MSRVLKEQHKRRGRNLISSILAGQMFCNNELTLDMARLENRISANVMSLVAIVVRPRDNHRDGIGNVMFRVSTV